MSHLSTSFGAAMTWKTKSSPLALAAFMCAAALPAQATVVVAHSLEEMSRRADVVVHAKVIDSEPTRDDIGRIITLSRLEVLDGIKGAKTGDVLTVFQVGGRIGERASHIVGAHKYTPGEEIVWFGMRHKQRFVAYGIGIGKFQVIYDGSFRRVVEQVGDVAVMERDASGKPTFRSPAARSAESLTAFKQQLRDAVALGDLPRSAKAAARDKKAPSVKVPTPQRRFQKKPALYKDTLKAKPEGAR